ncbi:hypothetical protein M1247_00605 [Mycobacterium sp. 21AC1]|uniref:hypothetical protein n=1 Tax=[Mycobacterium] appelbergii TaxID=2939269 RepID=UPI002938D40F|nr:hypothetical protein [Mycobacterium sp. 21AC1]MDV3123400.1 hypothetical protein [Mycobacterium sp. 21AC1]
MNGSTHPVPPDGPISPELLADLQAGLLDDAAATRLRHRVRSDPDAAATLAALDRVRRDLAALGADHESAPQVPPEAAARIGATLRAAAPPAHAAGSQGHRLRLFGAIAGACAAVLAIGLGVGTLLRAPDRPPAPIRVGQLTVSPPPLDIGLSTSQILELLAVPPELGPLSDPQRRAACLSTLGYPSGVRVLGGRGLDLLGRQQVLVLLAADTPNTVVGLVLAPDCDASHTGLLTKTTLTRP